MELRKRALHLLAAGMIATGGIASAAEQNEGSFTALSGIETQSLSTQEMEAITGQWDLSALRAALTYVVTHETVTICNRTVAIPDRLQALAAAVLAKLPQ